MIPLLIYAQLLDLATFLITADALGIDGEFNPIIVFLYGLAGPFGIIAFKGLAIMGFVILARRRGGRSERAVALIGAAFGTFGALTNILALAVSV